MTGLINPFLFGGAASPNTFFTGNRFWVSAFRQAAQTDNTELLQWDDQSGNGRHLTAVNGTAGAGSKPLYRTTIGAGGGPGVRFQSGNANQAGGYYSIPASVFTGLTSGCAWAIVKSSQAQTTLWDLGPTGTGSGHFPYDDVIYENAFVTARGTYVGTFIGVVNQWHRYLTAQTAGAGTQESWRNNTSLSTNSRTFGLPVSTGKLGGGAAFNFGGDVAAAGIIDHVPTLTERNAFDAWAIANQSG